MIKHTWHDIWKNLEPDEKRRVMAALLACQPNDIEYAYINDELKDEVVFEVLVGREYVYATITKANLMWQLEMFNDLVEIEERIKRGHPTY